MSVEELAEDREGEPVPLGAKQDGPLPEQVDHSGLLSPVRNQGDRATCMFHAIAAGIEAFAGLESHLSVEHVGSHFKFRWSGFLELRARGLRVAREEDWPYNGNPQSGIEERSLWGIDRAVSAGCKPERIRRILADRPTNNVIACAAWDHAFEEDGVFYKPDLAFLASLATKVKCRLAVCGAHCVLLVGYESRADNDGETRTFFKFKNSWSSDWGEGGYGYMSEAYLDQFCKRTVLITEGPTPDDPQQPPAPVNGCHVGAPLSPDYCTVACRCAQDEGHCDSDAECQAGLRCQSDVAGAPPGISLCAPPQAEEPGKPLGAACWANRECAEGLCLPRATPFCSRSCAAPRDCPAPYQCLRGVCDEPPRNPPVTQPPPAQDTPLGDFGDPCDGDHGCKSVVCLADQQTGQQSCSLRCDPVGSICPEGTQCQPAGQSWACVAESQDQGGCQLARATSDRVPVVLILLMVLGVTWRRSRAAQRS